MICPRCNKVSDTSETVCSACHALIAAAPVPFFRGADEWHDPSTEKAAEPTSTHSDLAAQFDDPVFEFGGEVRHSDGPSEFSVPDTSAMVVREEVPDTSTVRAALAPGWRRLAAGAVDALPLGGALMLMLLFFEHDLDAGGAPMIPSNLHELARMFVSLGAHAWIILAAVCAVSVLYHSFSVAYMRATVGDLLFGIRWVTPSGEAPRLGRALARAVLQVPSWLIAMCGVWSVFFTRTKRTLYDVVTGCYPVLRSS